MAPFIALIGIYIFNIIGSISVIKDKTLYTDKYYFSLVLIIISFYFFYFIYLTIGNKINIIWESKLYIAKGNINYLLIISLWFISLVVFYLYSVRNGLPSLFEFILSGNTDIYDIRLDKSTNLVEGMRWYNIAFISVPSLIFIYTYVLKMFYPSRKTKILFYGNLPFIIFFLLLTLHKTPIAYLIVFVMLIKIILDKNFRNFREVSKKLIVSIFIILIMLKLYHGDREINIFFQSIPAYLFNRIFVVYTEAHAHIIKILPDSRDFFYGNALPNYGGIFPFNPINLSQWLGNYIYGITMNYSSPSFTQGYANFGMAGVLLFIFLMFFQIIVFQLFFKVIPKNPIVFSFYILFLSNMINFATGPIDSVINISLLIFFIFVIFLNFLLNEIILKNKRIGAL